MNLSNVYSKLHPYRNFISVGMRVHYPKSGWYTVLGSNGKHMTIREEKTGEILVCVYAELQRDWELSDKDREFIEDMRSCPW